MLRIQATDAERGRLGLAPWGAAPEAAEADLAARAVAAGAMVFPDGQAGAMVSLVDIVHHPGGPLTASFWGGQAAPGVVVDVVLSSTTSALALLGEVLGVPVDATAGSIGPGAEASIGMPRYITTAQEDWAVASSPHKGSWCRRFLAAGGTRRQLFQTLRWGRPIARLVRPLP